MSGLGSQTREGVKCEDKEIALYSAKEVTGRLGGCKVIREVVYNAWSGGCGEVAQRKRRKEA